MRCVITRQDRRGFGAADVPRAMTQLGTRDGPTGQTGTGRHLTCSVSPTGTPVGLHSVRRVPDAAVQWSE